jgi:hypothetical protein
VVVVTAKDLTGEDAPGWRATSRRCCRRAPTGRRTCWPRCGAS